MSIAAGPTDLAVRETAWGLARYAAICQEGGLVPIIEPEILLDGDHSIDTTLHVFEKVWAETFKAMADNNVVFEGILLKPSMARHPTSARPRQRAARWSARLRQRRLARGRARIARALRAERRAERAPAAFPHHHKVA